MKGLCRVWAFLGAITTQTIIISLMTGNYLPGCNFILLLGLGLLVVGCINGWDD